MSAPKSRAKIFTPENIPQVLPCLLAHLPKTHLVPLLSSSNNDFVSISDRCLNKLIGLLDEKSIPPRPTAEQDTSKKLMDLYHLEQGASNKPRFPSKFQPSLQTHAMVGGFLLPPSFPSGTDFCQSMELFLKHQCEALGTNLLEMFKSLVSFYRTTPDTKFIPRRPLLEQKQETKEPKCPDFFRQFLKYPKFPSAIFPPPATSNHQQYSLLDKLFGLEEVSHYFFESLDPFVPLSFVRLHRQLSHWMPFLLQSSHPLIRFFNIIIKCRLLNVEVPSPPPNQSHSLQLAVVIRLLFLDLCVALHNYDLSDQMLSIFIEAEVDILYEYSMEHDDNSSHYLNLLDDALKRVSLLIELLERLSRSKFPRRLITLNASSTTSSFDEVTRIKNSKKKSSAKNIPQLSSSSSQKPGTRSTLLAQNTVVTPMPQTPQSLVISTIPPVIPPVPTAIPANLLHLKLPDPSQLLGPSKKQKIN